jgi:ATP-dependent DNA helicase PIF1
MKFFSSAIIAVYRRSFSTKSSRTTKYAQSVCQNRIKKETNRIPKDTKTHQPLFEWAQEQKNIFSHVHRGASVFITGSAGTGKTVLLKHIIDILKDVHGKSKVFVTASTGIAACALQGQTLHSFASIGIQNADSGTLLDKVKMNKHACKRWKKAKALVIDEISMISADLFESLEYIARDIRGSEVVWGGIQLIVCGDFFQLPPVIKQQKLSGKEFAFEADCWNASFDLQVELTQVFRQSDPRLIKMLQGIRKGETDAEDLQLLEESCSMNKQDSLVVWLYPRINDVEKVNEERMKSLGESTVTYAAADSGLEHRKKQLNQGIVPDQLVLCVGARVMLIMNLNIERNLCNGATGTVTGFVPVEDKNARKSDILFPQVKFDRGPEILIEPQNFEIFEGDIVVAWRYQIPLILAWAISIHKCQGMTLDHAQTDLSRAFGYGMVYVALSRVRSLEGLHLSGFTPSKIKAHPKVLLFYKSFTSSNLSHTEFSLTHRVRK